MLRINLQAVRGHWWCAEWGGGGDVNANRTQASGWETFTLTDLTDRSRLAHGDRIAL